MNLFLKHEQTIANAIDAIKARGYYSPYPENPKQYAEDGMQNAQNWFSQTMNNDFVSLDQLSTDRFAGEEVSPFMQVGIGVRYPTYEIADAIGVVKEAHEKWKKVDVKTRGGLLVEALDNIKNRFFDIAIATMHTSGQSFLMSFQASGPHANDRALEAVVMGYSELTRYVSEVTWTKPLGKFDLVIEKDFKALGKGIGLVIGCSTFPVWNTVPGLFANLITGNACIVKPHAKAVLPIAIVIEELQKVFKNNGIDSNTAFLFTDSSEAPKTKELANHPLVKIIDYTGNSEFGSYIENLPKTTFTEKAGVNSIIIDSVKDIKSVAQNIAFSISLYSGQMCTAPQNIFISKQGVKNGDAILSYEEVVKELIAAVNGLVQHPKAGPGTIAAIQSDLTLQRVKGVAQMGGNVLLGSNQITNEEFADARIATPVIVEVKASERTIYGNECFGPVAFIIATESTNESIEIAKQIAEEKGALTCGAYTTNDEVKKAITEAMNNIFVPVSFNFTGAGFINSHAAFSDFHLTGGNAAGNASFTNADFVNKRFVWVGNRYM